MSETLVGQEIEAYCGKCKEDTIHLITTLKDDKIEKVMCKVCMGYHKFKKPSKSKTEPVIKTAATKAKKTTRPRRNKWTRLLDDSDLNSAIEYKMEKNYEVATAIHHKTFGMGVVKSIIDNQKMEVLFQDGERIMVQNYCI